MVLPSCGAVLVTTIDRLPSSAEENTTPVRIALIDSRECRRHLGRAEQHLLAILQRDRRHEAEERQLQVRLDFIGGLDAAVEVLEGEHQAERQRQARQHRNQQIAADVREHRALRHFGRDQRSRCCCCGTCPRRRSPWPAASGSRRAADRRWPRARGQRIRRPCDRGPSTHPSAHSAPRPSTLPWREPLPGRCARR